MQSLKRESKKTSGFATDASAKSIAKIQNVCIFTSKPTRLPWADGQIWKRKPRTNTP